MPEASTLALPLQAQETPNCREELVTLLKDILHYSDVFATFDPTARAPVDFGRQLKNAEP